MVCILQNQKTLYNNAEELSVLKIDYEGTYSNFIKF